MDTQAPAPVEANLSEQHSPKVRIDIPIPPVPYLDLGYKGNFEKNLQEPEPKALDLFPSDG
jgi:hypothetical protein